MTTAAADQRPSRREGLPERVARLEERTRPKPKTILEKIKEWSGVIAAVIAIAYTFPTGVWVQWFAPEKKAAEELRNVIESSTMVLAEGLRAASTAKDAATAVQMNRYYTTRAYMLMARHEPGFRKYASALTPAELLVLGSNFGLVNRPELGLEFLDLATSTAERNRDPATGRIPDLIAYLHAARMKAQLQYQPGHLQDRTAARRTYAAGIKAADGAKSMYELAGRLDLEGDWAFMERSFGDWLCSETLLARARETYHRGNLAIFDGGQLLQNLDRTAALPRKPTQAAAGCDAQLG